MDSKKAIIFNPNYVEAYDNLGATEREIGFFEKSLIHFNRLSHLKPDYVSSDSKMGISYDDLNSIENSSGNYIKSLGKKLIEGLKNS